MKRAFLSIIVGFLALFVSVESFSVPLETFDTYSAAYPFNSKKGAWIQMLARGIGTNDMYVLEVDPTTGAIPVDANVTLSYDTNWGAVGANTLRAAAQIGNATGTADFNAGNASAQTLRVVVATDQSAIPVTGSFGLSNDTNWGVVGADTLRGAAQIGNATGAADFDEGLSGAQTLRVTIATDDTVTVDATNLDIRDLTSVSDSVAAVQSGTWNINNVSGTISLPTGASTAANQATEIASLASIDTNTGNTDTNTSAINGKLANDYGVSSGALRTASQVGNAAGVADFNTGTAGAQTLRVVQASNSPQGAGRAYGDSAYMSYSSTNVTTGAWVQLDASTAATINELYIFSSCSETVELGTGAAAAESRVLLIPPGGIDSKISLAIASGTRLALRGVSGDCTTGQITLTGLN
jgi:hypothetical protein